MTPVRLYRIAGWAYASIAALFALALVAGGFLGRITSWYIVLGGILFVVPCGLFSYAVLRRFPEPEAFPLWAFILIACYTGTAIYIGWEIGLLLATPLLVAAYATDRQKRVPTATPHLGDG